MSFRVVIPARLRSERLPDKPLATIGGKAMIVWCYERAAASGAEEVVVAVDDERIAEGCVWIPAGLAGSVGLGANGAAIEITRS